MHMGWVDYAALRAGEDMLTFDPSATRQVPFNGFGPAAIPDPRDQVMDDFLGGLRSQGSSAIGAVSRSTSEAGRRVLSAHAERLASRAVRLKEPRLLVSALTAAVLGGLGGIENEPLLPMALIDDARKRLGVDLAELFEQASEIVGHPGSVNLMIWLARAPEDRTPEAMGFEPVEDSGGFRYRWRK
jgi:hypothetical protein